jgi:cytoskeletal protein CcmA (bactofilin family)
MADTNRTTTVIGPDTHIKGEMVFESTARILGTFEGRVIAKGEIQIGEGAACKAAVEGTTVIVDGLIEGDVQLNAKARVVGDITATTLVVSEGASFTGNCRVGADVIKGARPAGSPALQNGEAAKRSREAGSPVISGKPTELESTLAGLEARLAGVRRPIENGTTEG